MARKLVDYDSSEMGPGFLGAWYSNLDEDGGGTKWAIFDRTLAESAYQDTFFNAIENNPSRVATWLTGWYRFDSGPGRAFGSAPCVKLYRHKILVWQRTGLDI